MMNEYVRSAANRVSASVDCYEERAVQRTMTELASALGDLKTAARAVAGRMSPLLPAGSPFDRADRVQQSPPTSTLGEPKLVRSRHCEDLHSHLSQIRELTTHLDEMAKSCEL